MNKTNNHSKANWLFFGLVIAGIALRLLAATCGGSIDIDSYKIVADIVDHGGNVYAGTGRYNYGPIWFHVLHGLDLLAWHNPAVFRYLLAGFLSLVDVGIFFVLWRKFGKAAACWFFFNPISIIITGFHCQFDNLAVWLGLLSVLLMGDEFDQPIGRRKLLGLLVLGLSLVTKHLLFAFPFWLAVKQKGMLQKLGVLLIPASIFVLSFVPYWPAGGSGIIQNVFLYRSVNNEYFYRMFVPMGLQIMFTSQAVWFFLLFSFAFICRQKNAIESLLLYTCLLVATSPATANQYLAIPVAFAATHLNLFTILYMAVTTIHLLVDVNGFHLISPNAAAHPTITAFTGGFPAYGNSLTTTACADIAVYFLFLGLVWVTWRQPIIALLERCILEAKIQLRLKK